jgi:hypothetical protein
MCQFFFINIRIITYLIKNQITLVSYIKIKKFLIINQEVFLNEQNNKQQYFSYKYFR